jgi:type IV/VI secretion system ImpK/VasF family protein
LIGDSDNEIGSMGDEPIPQNPPTAENSFRPFKSWASAYEPRPSMWARLRGGIAGIFSRPKKVEVEPEVIQPDVIEPDVVEPPAIELDAAAEAIAPDAIAPDAIVPDIVEPQAVEFVSDSSAVAPPDDFKFPWTRPGVEASTPAETLSDTPVAPELEIEESAAEPQPIVAPDERRPGFFARMFGRKPKTAEPDEASAIDTDDVVPKIASDALASEMSGAKTTEESEADIAEATYLAHESEPSGFDRATFDPPVFEPATYETPAFDASQVERVDTAPLDIPPDTPPAVPAAQDFGTPTLGSADLERRDTPPPVTVDEVFASVEEALPVYDDASIAIDAAAALAPSAPSPPPPAKRGLFARLLEAAKHRKPQEQPRRNTLEIEVHEDRIEAAAQALDSVGEMQFESFEGKSGVADEKFESVDEALPAAEASASAVEEAPPSEPGIADADLRFAPPETSGTSGTPETLAPPPLDDLPLIADFTPPESDRRTAEVSISDIPEPERDRTTAQVPRLELPELDEPVSGDDTADGFDGTSTLEIEEKTDEFEIAALETPATAEDATLEVEKKSFWTDSFVGRIFKRGDTQVEKAGVPKPEAEGNPVFLLAKFRAFYNEIIRFQHQKSEFTAGFATAIVTEYSADLSPDAAAEGLSKRLSELLELQAAEAKWMGGEAGERYPDAQYAMAALADETFTHLEWEGQGAWSKFSLERKIYQTNAADVEVFKRIDKLLKESPDSVVARDLARVYLLVLAAGFQGKWRPFALMRPIAEYRRRLYEYIHASDPLMLYAADRQVFPDAASRTLEGHAVARFTAMQRWTAILIVLVVTYTVVAHIAWSSASADLKDVTSRIKSGSSAAGAP